MRTEAVLGNHVLWEGEDGEGMSWVMFPPGGYETMMMYNFVC